MTMPDMINEIACPCGSVAFKVGLSREHGREREVVGVCCKACGGIILVEDGQLDVDELRAMQ